jgi:hypothetical protein
VGGGVRSGRSVGMSNCPAPLRNNLVRPIFFLQCNIIIAAMQKLQSLPSQSRIAAPLSYPASRKYRAKKSPGSGVGRIPGPSGSQASIGSSSSLEPLCEGRRFKKSSWMSVCGAAGDCGTHAVRCAKRCRMDSLALLRVRRCMRPASCGRGAAGESGRSTSF